MSKNNKSQINKILLILFHEVVIVVSCSGWIASINSFEFLFYRVFLVFRTSKKKKEKFYLFSFFLFRFFSAKYYNVRDHEREIS